MTAQQVGRKIGASPVMISKIKSSVLRVFVVMQAETETLETSITTVAGTTAPGTTARHEDSSKHSVDADDTNTTVLMLANISTATDEAVTDICNSVTCNNGTHCVTHHGGQLNR